MGVIFAWLLNDGPGHLILQPQPPLPNTANTQQDLFIMKHHTSKEQGDEYKKVAEVRNRAKYALSLHSEPWWQTEFLMFLSSLLWKRQL